MVLSALIPTSMPDNDLMAKEGKLITGETLLIAGGLR
jgi:hypothetical protein